nr:MAG TPA: Erythromycin resistance leader peptide [Caudoviricetes sp.]
MSGTALLRIATQRNAWYSKGHAMLCGGSASRRQRYSSELQSVDSTESFYKRSVST